MTNAGFRLPGARRRARGWSAEPTTPSRSWAELTETIHGGLALLDDNWRLGFVTDRFLPQLGHPDELVGNDLRVLLPALDSTDPRRIQRQAERGRRVEFEQHLDTSDGKRCWYRVTIVPCADLGGSFTAVVFAKDIAETSSTLAQFRDASVRLTEVEVELQRRVGRDVHDGPIQLLAALVFRLGMSETKQAAELQLMVSEVAKTLRHVIEDFVPESSDEWATVIGQWLDPLLEGSEIEMSIHDHRTAPSGLAEAQAAFVMVYQAVRAARRLRTPRPFRLDLTDERGGERITARSPSAAPGELSGRRAAHFRACVHHAQSLGGTLETWLTDDDTRVLTMWIPKLTNHGQHIAPSARPSNVDVREEPSVRQRNAVTALPPLRDSAWREIVNQAPERMIEFDRHMRVAFANAAHEQTIAVEPNALIGFSATDLFTQASLSQLDDAFGRLDAGHFVETTWFRENALGDVRRIHITMSPRLDDDDVWDGLFIVSEDRTDDELLDVVYQLALADIALARRSAVEASIRRLEQPLDECRQLILWLRAFEASSANAVPITNILDGLADSLDRVSRSTNALSAPDPVVDNLEMTLRRSLGGLLVGRRLTVTNDGAAPVSSTTSAVLFQIAREAVHNAVVHGGANSMSITQARSDEGVQFDIHDDGIGIDPQRLTPRPGHLGVRVMQERAAELGGSCTVQKHPDGGTLVSVWLPIETDAHRS